MKTHPQKGYKMLKKAEVLSEEASTIVLNTMKEPMVPDTQKD